MRSASSATTKPVAWSGWSRRRHGLSRFVVHQPDGFYTSFPGTTDRAVETVDQANMIHIMGATTNGMRGMSRIRTFAKNSIALQKTLEQVLGAAHENAILPAKAITLGAQPTVDGLTRMKAQVDAQNRGRANAGSTIWLDPGTTITPLSVNLVDLAIIDAMKFNENQIAQFFGVPRSLIDSRVLRRGAVG